MAEISRLFIVTGGTRLTDTWLDQPVPDDPPHRLLGATTDWLDDQAA